MRGRLIQNMLKNDPKNKSMLSLAQRNEALPIPMPVPAADTPSADV